MLINVIKAKFGFFVCLLHFNMETTDSIIMKFCIYNFKGIEKDIECFLITNYNIQGVK